MKIGMHRCGRTVWVTQARMGTEAKDTVDASKSCRISQGNPHASMLAPNGRIEHAQILWRGAMVVVVVVVVVVGGGGGGDDVSFLFLDLHNRARCLHRLRLVFPRKKAHKHKLFALGNVQMALGQNGWLSPGLTGPKSLCVRLETQEI